MKKSFTFAAALLTVVLFQQPALAAGDHAHGHSDSATQEQRIDVSGTLNSIDVENRSVNITHNPVAALKWPAMTMNFPLSEAVDLATLHADDISFVLVVAEDGSYKVDKIIAADSHGHAQ